MSLAPLRGWETPRCTSCRVIIIAEKEKAEKIAEVVRSRGFSDIVIYDPNNPPVIINRYCMIIVIPPLDRRTAEKVARAVFGSFCTPTVHNPVNPERCIADHVALVMRGVIEYGVYCKYGTLNDIVHLF